MLEGTSKNLLRRQFAALGSARNLAYLADMSRLLRAGRLASCPLITIFRGALEAGPFLLLFLNVFSSCGGSNTLDNVTERTLAGAVEGGRYGSYVAIIGDIDGNGFQEIAVSAPDDRLYGNDSGRVEVGSFDVVGGDYNPLFSIYGQAGETLAVRRIVGCDLNADQKKDIVMSDGSGNVLIFLGQSSYFQKARPSFEADLILFTKSIGAEISRDFGLGLACLNRSGIGDILLIGDPECTAPNAKASGCVYLYSPDTFGSGTRILLGDDIPTIYGTFAGERFGSFISTTRYNGNEYLFIAAEGDALKGVMASVEIISAAGDLDLSLFRNQQTVDLVDVMRLENIEPQLGGGAFLTPAQVLIDDNPGFALMVGAPGEGSESFGEIAVYLLGEDGLFEITPRTIIRGEWPGDRFGSVMGVFNQVGVYQDEPSLGRGDGLGRSYLLATAPANDLWMNEGGIVYGFPLSLAGGMMTVGTIDASFVLFPEVGHGEDAMHFGETLASSGSTVYVGAPGENSENGLVSGALHIFSPAE